MGNIKNGGERFVEALFTRPLDLSCCVRCSRADAWRRSRAVLLEEGPAFFPGDGAVVVLVELTEHHGPHGVGSLTLHLPFLRSTRLEIALDAMQRSTLPRTISGTP